MNFFILIRALRLPFILASILPFIAGSLFARPHENGVGFLLGLITVGYTHLSANLINDYADSRSGADWKNRQYYGLFGGSKLIQEGVLDEGFYLGAAVFFAALAGMCVGGLVFLLGSAAPLVYF
jgi:1,4-dihydroxy-2-naphthoate octaprenyltransferase